MKFKQLGLSCRLAFALSLTFTANAYAEADIGIVKRFYTLEQAPTILEKAGSDPLDALGDIPHPIPVTVHNEFLTVDNVINTGKAVWSIVDSGKPTCQSQSTFASSVPNLMDWQNLDSWKMPTAKSYDVIYKNWLGMTSLKFTYIIHYTYGGHYKGHGLYLTNVTVQASKIELSWGSKLSAKAEIPSVLNIGTLENPIAGMMILVGWQVSSLFSYYEDSMSYFLKGDGSLETLRLNEN